MDGPVAKGFSNCAKVGVLSRRSNRCSLALEYLGIHAGHRTRNNKDLMLARSWESRTEKLSTEVTLMLACIVRDPHLFLHGFLP